MKKHIFALLLLVMAFQTCGVAALAAEAAGDIGGSYSGASAEIALDSENEKRGIFFEGKNGRVYGNQTLAEDLVVAEGSTLTIPDGAGLTIAAGVTLTNYGSVKVDGGVKNNGTIKNHGVIVYSVPIAGSGRFEGNAAQPDKRNPDTGR